MTLPEFKKYAAWGSASAWDRYNYAHLKVLINKTGGIQKLIKEKAVVPTSKVRNFINASLDHYINQIFRFIKCSRDGYQTAAHLEAAESISPLLDALFALESRLKPFYKYLEWGLKKYPLKHLPYGPKELVRKIEHILSTADLKTQQDLLIRVEGLFRGKGYGGVFDGWEGRLLWMEKFKTKKQHFNRDP